MLAARSVVPFIVSSKVATAEPQPEARPRGCLIAGAWARGREAWPGIELSMPVLGRWIEPRAERDADAPGSFHAADAFLACACLERIPGAIESFTQTYEPVLFAYAFRVARRRDAARELAQELLVRLLFGDGGSAPKLAEYAGRGPLRGWLRTVVTRRALNARRDARRQAALEVRADSETARADDPERGFLRALYAPQVRAAFLDALAVLSPPERGLLRDRYCDGLGLDAIAAPHGWSKPTACRRIAAARDRARSELTTRLRDALGVTALEVDSVLQLVVDTIEIDLSSVLCGARANAA